MRIAAGDDGNGREGEEMAKPGGYGRGHDGRARRRAFGRQHLTLSREHTPADTGAARIRGLTAGLLAGSCTWVKMVWNAC